MLSCPVCRQPLVKVSVPGRGFFHQCREHGKLALDLFLKTNSRSQQWLQSILTAPDSTPTRPLGCPYCLRTMTLKKESGLAVDRCHRCRTIWFDSGEFEALHHLEESQRRVQLAQRTPAQPDPFQIEVQVLSFNEAVVAPLGLEPETKTESKKGRLGYSQAFFAVALFSVMATVSLMRGDLSGANFIFQPALGFWSNRLSLLLAGFGHSGWVHLGANLYVLSIFILDIEEDIGALKTLFVFLTGVFCGNVAYTWMGETVPALGSSGGVYAIMAYFISSYPYRKISILRPIGSLLTAPNFFHVRLPAVTYACALFAGELVAAHWGNSSASGVAHIAHVGGFVGGLLLYAWMPPHQNQSGTSTSKLKHPTN